MSEVSPTQTHDGMGALHAGNTVESLRPRQGFEINKDGAEQVSQRPRFEVTKNDFVMLEPEVLPEPIAVEFTAGVAIPEQSNSMSPTDNAHLDTVVAVFRTLVQLYDTIEAVQKRVADLESRLEAHNVRGSHKI